VAIEGKESLPYDKLLIASGAKNRVPNIQGLSAVNYYSLRNKEDYIRIGEALKNSPTKNVTIIGGGFIGMEMASAVKLAHKDANVTVLEANSVPLQQVLGAEVGTVLQRLSEKNGVKIITNARIKNV
jgi:NADPH-dependent 2,4-dienoyl-CoA reductase/sulfur reductase-like enzyme